MLDGLRDDPGTGGEDEVVVTEWQAVGERHSPGALIDRGDLADDELDALVQQRTLRPLETGRPFAAHRDVHEAWLVHVLAGLVHDRDRDLTRVGATPQLPDEEVGGECSPDTTAQDEDPLHRVTSVGLLDDDLVVALVGSEPDQAVPRLADPLRDIRATSGVRAQDGEHLPWIALADRADQLHERPGAIAAARVDR